MGMDYRIQFRNKDWYVSNRARVAERMLGLPSARPPLSSSEEIWLKHANSPATWEYDARLFLGVDAVDVEITSWTDAVFVDLRKLVEWLREQTLVEVVDDDGEPLNFGDAGTDQADQ